MDLEMKEDGTWEEEMPQKKWEPEFKPVDVTPMSKDELKGFLDDLIEHVPDAQKQMAFPDTPQGRLLKLHFELSEEARLLMEKKNHDYASPQDPYRNFRLYGILGVLVRLGDKQARLMSFVEQQTLKVGDESIRDTVKDIINYAVIFLGMLEESQKRQ